MGRRKSTFRISFRKSVHQDRSMKSKQINGDDIDADDDFVSSDNMISSSSLSSIMQRKNNDDNICNNKNVEEETHQEDRKEESQNDKAGIPSTITTTTATVYSKLSHIIKDTWIGFILYMYNIFGMIYSFVVTSIADFVTSILIQPQLQDAIVTIIVRAINTWTDQENIGSDIAQKMVLLNRESRLQASRQVGKEVIPLISGFVGGVAHSLKPAGMKTGKETQQKPSKTVKKKDSTIEG